MTAATVRPRGPGRPRDERADRAILDAALERLAEVGPTGLSVEEVAARAGVTRKTQPGPVSMPADIVTTLMTEPGS